MKSLLALALLIGCAKQPSSGKTSAKKQSKHQGRYAVANPGEGWSTVKPGGADKAWRHKETGATIYFDSNCLDRFEDGELSALLTHLTFGVAQGEPLLEEDRMLDGRSAKVRVQPGLIDGVQVRVGAMVTIKNSCLYDGLLIASPSTFESHWETFSEVLAGFRTQGR